MTLEQFYTYQEQTFDSYLNTLIKMKVEMQERRLHGGQNMKYPYLSLWRKRLPVLLWQTLMILIK